MIQGLFEVAKAFGYDVFVRPVAGVSASCGANTLNQLLQSSEAQSLEDRVTRTCPKELIHAKNELVELYRALKTGNDSSNIIFLLNRAISALETLIGHHENYPETATESDLQRIQHFFQKDNHSLPNHIFLYLVDCINQFKECKSILENPENLHNALFPQKRLQLLEVLDPTPVDEEKGVLIKAILKEIEERGGKLQTVIDQVVTQAIDSATYTLGRNLEKAGIPNLFNGPQTPLEIYDREGRPVQNMQKKPITFSNWIKAGYAFLTKGNRDEVNGCILSTLVPCLNFLQKKVEQEIAKSHEILTSATDLSTQEQELHRNIIKRSERTIEDLRQCITITRQAQERTDKEYHKRALKHIQSIMEKHPIWVESFFQLPIPSIFSSDDIGPVDPIEDLRKEIQILERNNPNPEIDEDFNYKEGIDAKITGITKTGSFMGAYSVALTYFMGDPPDSLKERCLPFPSIMQGIGGVVDPVEKRNSFIRAVQTQIELRQDIFFIKRWIIKKSFPLILWGCEVATERFATGAKKFLNESITKSKSLVTGEVTIIPIALITDVIQAITIGIKNASKFHISKGEAIREYLHGPEFLRGHRNVAALYKKFGDTTIKEFLGSINSARSADNIINRLTNWTYSPSTPKHVLKTILSLLIKVPLYAIKTIILHPFDFVANIFIKSLFKLILKQTNAVKKLESLTIKALFPDELSDFTEVMDKMLINLLKKLQQLLNAPKDPNGTFHTLNESPATNQALTACLEAVFANLVVKNSSKEKNQQRDAGNRTWIDQIKDSIGDELTPKAIEKIIGILNRSYQLLMTEEFLNEQLYSLLTITSDSMLQEGKNLTIDGRAERSQEHIQRKAMIAHYLDLVLWESIKLATTSISASKDTDTPIQKHIDSLKSIFLGGDTLTVQRLPEDDNGLERKDNCSPRSRSDDVSLLHSSSAEAQFGERTQRSDATAATLPSRAMETQSDNLLTEWKTALSNAFNADSNVIIPTLTEIYNKLKEISETTQRKIAAMELEGVGSASLNLHKKDLMALIEQQKRFRENFLIIYNFHLKRVLNDSIFGQLSGIDTLCLNIKELLQDKFDPSNMSSESADLHNLQSLILRLEKNKTTLNSFLLTQARENKPIPGDLNSLLKQLTMQIAFYKKLAKSIEQFHSLLNLIEQLVPNKPFITDIQSALRDTNLLTNDEKELYTANLETFKRCPNDSERSQAAAVAIYQHLTQIRQTRLDRIKDTTRQRVADLTSSSKLINEILQEINIAKRPSNATQSSNLQIQAAAIQSLKDMEKALQSMHTPFSIQLKLLENNPLIKTTQNLLFQLLSKQLKTFMKESTGDSIFISALLHKVYIKFLETHGEDIHIRRTSSAPRGAPS